MAQELSRHGYTISAGTLYPLLHGLEKKAICVRNASGMGTRFAGFIAPRLSVAKR